VLRPYLVRTKLDASVHRLEEIRGGLRKSPTVSPAAFASSAGYGVERPHATMRHTAETVARRPSTARPGMLERPP
jgi:hypothetical protein